jgi:hypothetical protein
MSKIQIGCYWLRIFHLAAKHHCTLEISQSRCLILQRARNHQTLRVRMRAGVLYVLA